MIASAAPCGSPEGSVNFEKLTFRSVTVRSVLVPLRRPVVSRVGLFDQWPIILIDLATEQGIVGRSYLEPYLKHAARYIVPAIHDLADARKGQPIRPMEDFQNGRRALNLIGYEGVAMIAVSGLDMAAWDALARVHGVSLVALLGGSPKSVNAYGAVGYDGSLTAARVAEAGVVVVVAGGLVVGQVGVESYGDAHGEPVVGIDVADEVEALELAQRSTTPLGVGEILLLGEGVDAVGIVHEARDGVLSLSGEVAVIHTS